MTVLKCDLDPNDDLFRAFQTMLDVFSSTKKALIDVQRERDALLISLKSFETERLPDDVLDLELSENRRKRIKTDPNKTSASLTSDSMNEDVFNAAFSSSMFEEDEVILPTQIHLNDSIQMKKEYNKENNESFNLNSMAAVECSPTVISKCHVKKQPNETSKKHQKSHISDQHESSLVHKTRSMSIVTDSSPKSSSQWKTVSRRLVDTKTIDTISTRKRLSLPRVMKQSTISFPKCDDETYCEGFSMRLEKSQSTITAPKNTSALARKTMSDPIKKTSIKTEDSVIAIVKDTPEIISIDESEPTQELYQHVVSVKNEKPTSAAKDIPKNPQQQLKNAAIDCVDCAEYYRMMGRDLEKNPPKKYGVCSKHRRNIQQQETPPGFWCPKIIDSDDDEETPFDPRYIRN